MNELALFAGVGGGLLGSILLGWRTVCAVELDPYCRAVFAQRQDEGYLDTFPIWDDVRTFDGTAWRGRVDVVTAGFPCQPFSVAGRRKGEADDRNLWPDTIRVIRQVGPRFCLLENVPGLLAHDYFGTILGDLAESGFRFGWRVLSAAELGAPHRRDRLWIRAEQRGAVALASGGRGQTSDVCAGRDAIGASRAIMADTDAQANRRIGDGRRQQQPESRAGKGDVANAQCPRSQEREGKPGDDGGERAPVERSGRIEWWATDPADRFAESGVGRLVDGCPCRVDRLRAIGNAQVPAVVAAAWALLTAAEQREVR